jgi:hypothetical protein
MALSLMDTGQVGVIAASIDATSGTDAVLTTRDGAASMVRNAAGDYTITFGSSFLSTPVVVATPVDATFSTLAEHSAIVQAVDTDTVQFNIITNATNGTVTALADIDFHFIVVGARNR